MNSAKKDFNKATPMSRDISDLLQAALRGDAAAIEASLEAFGDDFADTSFTGTSALMLAAAHNHTGVMEVLLSHGADINDVNSDGDTALIWALYDERAEAAQLLLDHGADVSIVNKMNKTAFDYVEKLSRPDIVRQMRQGSPRYIEKTVDRGLSRPLPVRQPLKFLKK